MSTIIRDKVTALCVVCKTRDLFEIAYQSFRRHYPTVRMIVVNGLALPGDDCAERLRELERADADLLVLPRRDNVGHGPGMNQAIRQAKTPYVYVFDSDTRMDRPVLEPLLNVALHSPGFHSIGSLGKVDETGHAEKHFNPTIPYVHPSTMLVNALEYLRHAPFIEHGAPCLSTAIDLRDRGESDKLINFPVRDYVFHGWRGTRNVTGRYL